MSHTKRLEINAKLLDLRAEHRQVDAQILELEAMQPYCNQLELRRLKKKKLIAKDQISRLESLLIPNLDA